MITMSQDFIHAEFNLGKLDVGDLDVNPFSQFEKWYDEVQRAGITEYPAMTLATCGGDRRPSARIVYLRNFDSRGYVFYTNYQSRKGQELASNPLASVCFYWKELERQIRIEGRIEKVSAEESDAYFAGRPRESRLGAWASLQSEVLDSPKELEARVEEFRQKFDGQEVPRPDYWGGYRLIPDRFEFWQGRPSRLHDRFVYQLSSHGSWSLARHFP